MVLKDSWLDQARRDFNAEVEYVYNEFGPQAAEKAYRKVLEGVDNLRHFPGMGRRYEGLAYKGNEVHVLALKQVSIIYCHLDEVLKIVAVWNNHQDLSNCERCLPRGSAHVDMAGPIES